MLRDVSVIKMIMCARVFLLIWLVKFDTHTHTTLPAFTVDRCELRMIGTVFEFPPYAMFLAMN